MSSCGKVSLLSDHVAWALARSEGVKPVRTANEEGGVAQSAVHQSLQVLGQLDGAHLGSVLVEEDEVVDPLKVFVGHGSLLFHHACGIRFGVLAFQVGRLDVLVFGVAREALVVHLHPILDPRL